MKVYRNAGGLLSKMEHRWFHQPGFKKGARKPLFGNKRKRR